MAGVSIHENAAGQSVHYLNVGDVVGLQIIGGYKQFILWKWVFQFQWVFIIYVNYIT